MKLPFLRKTEREEPLVVSMTGVRLGNRLLYVGGNADLFEPLAARVGLSGQTTVVASDPDALKTAAERDGVLIDAVTTIPSQGDFDLAVVEALGAWPDAVISLLGPVRVGGRLIVIAGARRGWRRHLRAPAEPAPPDSEIVHVLEAAGWTPARGIGSRDGVRFIEGFRH